MNPFIRIGVHFAGFAIAMIGLSSLDFNRLLKKNRVKQAQLLYVVLAMVLGYGIAQFLLSIMWTQLS